MQADSIKYTGMIYICSDIHGLYDRYEKLLEAIGLQDTDTLYILGDMIDRGNEGIRIIRDMMKRPNVIPFLGNHEHMMLMYLFGFDQTSWLMDCNGGRQTLLELADLSPEERMEIVMYLDEAYVVRNLNINGHRYSLSHIGVFAEDGDLKSRFTDDDTDVVKLQDMVWGRKQYNLQSIIAYPEELCPTTFISGHIITRRYASGGEKDHIIDAVFENGCRYIDLDCGCAVGDGEGSLACIAIDEETGEIDTENVIYIK